MGGGGCARDDDHLPEWPERRMMIEHKKNKTSESLVHDKAVYYAGGSPTTATGHFFLFCFPE